MPQSAIRLGIEAAMAVSPRNDSRQSGKVTCDTALLNCRTENPKKKSVSYEAHS
jgi:hypothetical protein